MAHTFMSMKLYDQQYFLRLGLLVFALFIAFASLFYTNDLVVKLGEREQKLIDLYAKGLESAAQAENTGNLAFLFQEIIQANSSVPVILATESGKPLSYKNLYVPEFADRKDEDEYLKNEMRVMERVYKPIALEFSPGLKNYIYYKNSILLTQLKFYPYIQLTVIFIFIFLGYLVVNNSRRAEQNRVWVGMAKETAHQLGTPISSLMAWTEIFKGDEHFSHREALHEIEKDILRLETVTSRFSNIGSTPILKEENAVEVVHTSISYMQQRVSKKVFFEFTDQLQDSSIANIRVNRALFEWALENLVKNAVDAMSGTGKLTVVVSGSEKQKIYIDITDTGKGMLKTQMKKVFNPGFTTKQRGWGLGLTLTKRIVEEYHGGKISVKHSEPGKGTTFRIEMKKIEAVSVA